MKLCGLGKNQPNHGYQMVSTRLCAGDPGMLAEPQPSQRRAVDVRGLRGYAPVTPRVAPTEIVAGIIGRIGAGNAGEPAVGGSSAGLNLD